MPSFEQSSKVDISILCHSAFKNKIEDATNIQCVSSELILFFPPGHASLLIFCTAAVLALPFLFMISAFP